MLFDFDKYKVDIDVQKTKAFYDRARLVSEACSCDGCQNFARAVETLPHSVTFFFTQLGIDMKKVCECYVYCRNDDGTLMYGGFYHLCGTKLDENSAWVKDSSGTACYKEESTLALSKDFRISFEKFVYLLEADFPLPVIQLEIYANIPWVLKKENPY